MSRPTVPRRRRCAGSSRSAVDERSQFRTSGCHQLTRPDSSDTVVVEVARRGKLVVGEPFFTAATPLLLDRKGLADAGPGDLVVARRTRGRARVERVLGPADRIENVLEALLVETGSRVAFEPFTPPAVTLDGRVDLRELRTLTIDPETAKDFDDALSIDDERAYVHIADVSYFVHAGSPLDYGAARRGFSTYVPGLVAPMLPHELADDLCSLRPHVDRLCVTVELPLDESEPAFYRSVIRSDARLSYGEAARILAGAESFPLVDVLRRLDARARDLRHRRFARGALRIQTPEVVFEFDGRGGVASAHREGEPEAHALVEEFMIRTNEAVAELLASRNRTALYRVHERPDPQSVLLLLSKLAELDVPTPPAPDELTSSSAAAVAAAAAEQVETYVVQSGRGRDAFPPLVLRALKQARYDPRNLGHAGLASRAYCHFTPTIRRRTTRPSWPSTCPHVSAKRHRSSIRRTRSASRGYSTPSSSSAAGRNRLPEKSSASSAPASSFASPTSSKRSCRRGACRATT